jgi:hypothetical protein
LGVSWEVTPNLEYIYKPEFFDSPKRFRNSRMLNILEAKPFLCREVIEEANFGGHFRELRSAFFQCRHLCWILEVEQKTARLVSNPFDVLLM